MIKSKLPLLALIFLTLFVGACSTKEKGNIYGLVTESGSAEPVRAAGVSLSFRGSLLLRTVTYDDGHFEFNDLAPGMYEILVELEGYKYFSSSVVVESGRTARTDMQLKKINTGMTVLTYEPSVQGNTVSFSGKCSYSGDSPNEMGFVYGAASSPTVKNGNVVKASSGFKVEINTLSKGVYYVRAYATNSKGTEYGENKRFEIFGLPGVITLAATNTTVSTATLNGRIEYAGDPAYTEKGFVYSRYFNNPTIDDPASSTTRIKVTGSSNDFSANVSGLTKDATYYVRAYAINSSGTVYGSSAQFVASAEVPYYILDAIAVQKTDIGIMYWDSAQTACQNSRVGGFANWRVPTRAELSLVYTNRSKIGGFGTDYYWTSEKSSSNYYYVNFSNGSSSYDNYNSRNYSVRCVRSLN